MWPFVKLIFSQILRTSLPPYNFALFLCGFCRIILYFHLMIDKMFLKLWEPGSIST